MDTNEVVQPEAGQEQQEMNEEDVSRETSNDVEDVDEPSVEEESKENYKEDKESQGFTPEEKTQVESFMKKMGIPKEVSYLLDKNGVLKFVVPADGKKYAVTPEELIKGWNLNQVGYQKLTDSKRIEKEFRDYLQAIKNEPKKLWELADKLGVDKYELSKMALEEKIAEEEMTPEQREAMLAKQENEKLKKEIEERRLAEEKQKLDLETQKEIKRYDYELTEAMKKHGFSKKDTQTKSRILGEAVTKMMLAYQSGHNLSADDAVYLAKQDWQGFINGVFDEIEEDHILDLIPPNIIKAIRKADLSKLEKDVIPTSHSVGQELDLKGKEVETVKPKKKRKQSLQDYFEAL